MAVPRLTPTSDGDMLVPSQSAATPITRKFSERGNIVLIVILLILNFAILRYCAPQCCRATGRWWARHSPIVWVKNLLFDMADAWSLSSSRSGYYPHVLQDDEEGIPLQSIPLRPRDERPVWARRADWHRSLATLASLSGQTLAPDEVTLPADELTLAETATETTPPGSMDIVSMRDQELSRTRSEREAEARENVDIAARGVVSASESRRPHKREETETQ
ncbi:MAG: hypothetical protein Q9182_004539 [Xanthomendoza sp. 2 TL-2023]